jgi:glycerophosphoryl diester phosphodiesterase
MTKPSTKYSVAISICLLVAGAVGALVANKMQSGPEYWREPLPPLPTERPNRNPFTIAHRGASVNAPGNSLVAVERAIALGFDYVELDVRYTSDNVPVLLHDGWVDETTNGSGRVSELTLAQLQSLDAGSWYSDEFAGIKVATLEDGLKLMQGKACLLWHAKALPRKETVELVQKYGFTDGCLIIGIPGSELEGLVRSRDSFWLSAPLIIAIKKVGDLPAILETYPGVAMLSLATFRVTPEIVVAAHAAGLPLMTRTTQNLDNPRFYRRTLESGVDGLMLKDIERLRLFLMEGLPESNETTILAD